MLETQINPLQIMVIMMVMGLLPIFLTLVTSYIKIIVVAFIVIGQTHEMIEITL